MTDIPTKIAAMKHIAAHKVAMAQGSAKFVTEIEANLETIALAKLAGMAPVNENLLGLSLMLLAEVKRQRGA